MRSARVLPAIALLMAFSMGGGAVAAETCTAAELAAAVDKSGAELRDANAKSGAVLLERMRAYAAAKGIPEAEAEDAAFEAVQDDRLRSLDEQGADLLLKIDQLGRVGDGAPADCAKIAEIRTASAVLLSVMRQKSEHMIARLNALAAPADGAKSASVAKPAAGTTSNAAAAEPPKRDVAPPAPKPAEPRAASRASTPGPGSAPGKPWETATRPVNDAYNPLPEVAINAPQPAGPGVASPAEQGYSIDEIREATRGFFGTVSTNLASVIEHAFKTSGRPTAYVLGTEGGGAFLAGLRYGKGTLFLRDRQETRQLYWHGPSVGADFGASGSRTMFLIYKLDDPDAIYRSFTGVDGSAFFVGGVGFTLIKGGDVIMAPIRSGLGFRLGANLGYVRFTDRPTWNPF